MTETLLGFRFVLVSFIAYFIQFSSAIVVLEPFSISFPNLPAKFARGYNTGLCGAIEVADPLDACTPLRNEFGSNKTDSTRFALIIRGNCSFEEKIRKAQSGGFSAAIVYDDKDMGNLVYMMVNPKGIEVLAVFVSKFAGEFLKDHAKGEKEECCIYLGPNVNPLTIFAICFLSLVVLAVFLVTALIPPRIFWIWRRKHLVKSVDNKIVEALPRVTFSSSRLSHCHTGETCAICLEDYKDGEVLKFLPCQHDFHSSCVESWLTKWGTFCPVCKLDVISKTAFSEVSERRT
ncbi:receptor homology region transmembrane domain ring H2 motif protein 1 [Hibiscus trionum]|uniref:Receptor homology region transmembrane domain ring H2 motif protein 1 n=1 Tax=Hibiscus trionum TaxID=183268 RepID=A0A9W7GVR4_HIBTR|nr:receptor homology region transmembrane domain ring H2 motif protein 1 [Hibiscus trionum]